MTDKAHLSENRTTKNADPQSGAAGAGMPVPSIREGDAGLAPGQPPALPHPSASSAIAPKTSEPVAWRYRNRRNGSVVYMGRKSDDLALFTDFEITPLYAAPVSPPPEVRRITDAEMAFAALVVQKGGSVTLTPLELMRDYELERTDDFSTDNVVFTATIRESRSGMNRERK